MFARDVKKEGKWESRKEYARSERGVNAALILQRSTAARICDGWALGVCMSDHVLALFLRRGT